MKRRTRWMTPTLGRWGLIPMLAVAILALPSTPANATPVDTEVVTITFASDEGARLEFDGRRYVGPLVVTRHRDGLAVTERASIEQYLEGVAEMPFSWREQALAAQAVAARTYLTRRLLGGRQGDAATYGYDICATNRCQVYRGVQLVEGDAGDRWKSAVESTADEIMLYAGRPIEAVFTSMVGSRSRANQDVWSSDPVPYLQPVDSPELGIAPYAEWEFEITAAQFVEILRADGLDVGGALIEVSVSDPPEGQGRTEITVVTEAGTDAILAPAMKGSFNRHGDELYPGALPARSSDGSMLPEPLLSYTYELDHIVVPERAVDALLPYDDRADRDVIRIAGEGWGHGVGMSQWGAQIMAGTGSTYSDILTHYYTGATLESDATLVPDTVVVGLSWGLPSVEVVVSGTAVLQVNGVPYASISDGTYLLRTVPGGIIVIPAGDRPLANPIDTHPWPR